MRAPEIVPNRPGWDDDPALPQWRGYGALDGAQRADACVIGLGASGLAAIAELARRGLSVIGLDAGRVAGGAAGRNGGFLSAGGALPLPGPGSPVRPEVWAGLHRETSAELHWLIERFGGEVVRRIGLLCLAGLPGEPLDEDEERAAAAYLTDLRAEQQALASLGVAAEDYDGGLGQGYLDPTSAVVNPVRRAFALAAALPAGVRLHEYSPVTMVRSGKVTTARGSVAAGVVIVAVDGTLEVLLPQLAPGVQTVRLQMIATAPITPGRVPYALSYRDGFDWVVQDESGRLLLGGGRDHFRQQETTTDDEPTPGVQRWIDGVAARVAGEPVTVTHRWAASAGFTPDRRALCVPVEQGVVACGGYSGWGNLVGPVAGRAAVALAVDQVRPPVYFRSSL